MKSHIIFALITSLISSYMHGSEQATPTTTVNAAHLALSNTLSQKVESTENDSNNNLTQDPELLEDDADYEEPFDNILCLNASCGLSIFIHSFDKSK